MSETRKMSLNSAERELIQTYRREQSLILTGHNQGVRAAAQLLESMSWVCVEDKTSALAILTRALVEID